VRERRPERSGPRNHAPQRGCPIAVLALVLVLAIVIVLDASQQAGRDPSPSTSSLQDEHEEVPLWLLDTAGRAARAAATLARMHTR
jgi:hypothetical protein